MKLHKLAPCAASSYASFGCMWEKGRCAADSVFRCVNSTGAPVPMQTRVTAYWPDGSIKWTAHTADGRLMSDEVEVLPAEAETPFSCALRAEKAGEGWVIDTGISTISIPGPGARLFDNVMSNGKIIASDATAELLLEEPSTLNGRPIKIEKSYTGRVEACELEERGALQITVKYTGSHMDESGEAKLPFIIRMRVNAGCSGLHFTHTFLYDGDENTDYLKGIGIRFNVPMGGAAYNRHIKFAGDSGAFHEALVGLTSWRPRIPAEVYQKQMSGELISETGDTLEKINKVMEAVPVWSGYDICQDSAEHFVIRKKLNYDNVCAIDALHGRRAAGGLAFGSEIGSVSVAMRDFWEKYPSGYTVSGLDADEAACSVWFWHPAAPVMDFRHYANRGYNQVCYEGYDYKGATPDGIACTNECVISFSDRLIPTDEELITLTRVHNESAVYVATPEEYHRLRAFGYWSLPSRETETENWLEDQLEMLFDFYRDEVDRRGWYGMFNYGDFMHTYDSVRHQWKYDVGGYAWDNTELVPTLWLWTYFLRTGRYDVYRLAEKLSRHASEVDVYHMGKYKGLGSRHNVRHWGCPCKEARIAMAHHHRYMYYMTGDLRLTDIFDELKDNELSFYNKDPLGDFYDKAQMVYPSHARSGPDWSSLCSNWLTQWERTGDTRYRDKMLVGMQDIKNAPLRLISGPDFEFDPATQHLRYIGERTTGGTHLQICMGAPSVWTEMADLLEDENWRQLMAEYGRFYYLPNDEKQAESRGLIGSREFSLPFMAASMGAFGAKYLNDADTARRVWAVLLHTVLDGRTTEGFASIELPEKGNHALLTEIPWITTNFAAQFGINTIMSLDFISDKLPKTLREANELAATDNPLNYHKA